MPEYRYPQFFITYFEKKFDLESEGLATQISNQFLVAILHLFLQ